MGKFTLSHPASPSVFGIKAYKSVLDVVDDIDLAVVATPSKIVPSVMEEIGKKKIKASIIVSAGFREVDESGAKLEEIIKDIGKHYGIRIIGPNCLGIMSLTEQNLVNLTFLKITPKYGRNRIGFSKRCYLCGYGGGCNGSRNRLFKSN